jgi:hypothetical protein
MPTRLAEEMVADMYTGTVRTLEGICRQLIDAKVLNAELLLADLLQAQTDLAGRKLGHWASVPAALYAALGGQSPK